MPDLKQHRFGLTLDFVEQYFPRAHVWNLLRSCTAGRSGDRLPGHPPRPSKCAEMAQLVCQAGTARGKRFDARRRTSNIQHPTSKLGHREP
jgi:hypothetical protein